MKKFSIFLDLDCVIADFISGVAYRFGVPKAKLEAAWEPGVYSCNPPLEKALKRKPGTMTEEEFWKPINGDAVFWAELPVFHWMAELIELVEKYDKEWFVLTSPSWCISAHTGKAEWLKSKFGIKFDRFAITPHKQHFARPDAILIDDYEKNIDKFCSTRNGNGILFPALHNVLHKQRKNPLAHVKTQLEKIHGT